MKLKKQLINYIITGEMAARRNGKLYWGITFFSIFVALFLLSLIYRISGYMSLWFALLFGNLFIFILHYKLYNQFNKSKYKIEFK